MYRNVPLERFARTLAEFDCDFHCLQHGDIREDIEILKSELGSRLHTDTFDPKASVEDMGGRLLEMDGVITIDNTTLHIAGALGVTTLALISIPAYWQWPVEGKGSRWYKSVKLLRQDAPGHWHAVLGQASAELKLISPNIATAVE
jgi:ADP-heptose:LPS heptosyltransferase